MSVVFNSLDSTLTAWEQAWVDLLETVTNVTVIPDGPALTSHDYTDVQLLVVRTAANNDYTAHPQSNSLDELDVPILTMCRHVARVSLGMGSASSGGTSSTFSKQGSGHPTHEGFASTVDIYPSPLATGQITTVSTGVTILWRPITGTSGISIKGEGRSARVHFGPVVGNSLTADGEALFLATAEFLAGEWNAPPDAPTLVAPEDEALLAKDVVQRFSWTFNDPDEGDSQSAFDFRWRPVGGSWTTVSDTTTTEHYDVPAGTFAAGDHEWEVRTYDNSDAQGPWSETRSFTAQATPNAPNILEPVNNGTIPTTDFTVEWSVPTQTAFEVRRMEDDAGDPGEVLWTSGQVTSTARQLTVGFPTNETFEHVQVRVLRDGLWSAWASVRVEVSYTPPPTADITTFTPLPLEGRLKVDWTLAAPSGTEPDVDFQEVFRRQVMTSENIRFAVLGPHVRTWLDPTPASGVEYEYRVQVHGDNETVSSSPWTG